MKTWKLNDEAVRVSFEEQVKQKCQTLPDNVDESWIHLKNALLEAVESTCGWTKGGRVRHSETWWWNDEVEDKIKAKQAAWKLWKMVNLKNTSYTFFSYKKPSFLRPSAQIGLKIKKLA